MGFVMANHDTENRSNDLPIYLVLYESLTMLKKKVWWGQMKVKNLFWMPFLATSIFT